MQFSKSVVRPTATSVEGAVGCAHMTYDVSPSMVRIDYEKTVPDH